jgi:hypothetical protein
MRFFVCFQVKTHDESNVRWCNKFRFIHVCVLIVCMNFFYWLPLMNGSSAEILELSSYEINGSLTKNEQFYRAYGSKYFRLLTRKTYKGPFSAEDYLL